jgi:hypothetical protein
MPRANATSLGLPGLRAWRRFAGARTILDDKRLLQVLTEFACEQPDGHIARAAGPVGHEDADRLAKRNKSRCAAVPTRRLRHWLLIPLIF